MKLEFGKYTDVTNLAKETNPEMFDIYEKVYICPDTNNWWVSAIQKDINQDYEKADGTYLIERADIDYPENCRIDNMFLTPEFVKTALKEWDGSCWDNCEAGSLKSAIEIIDGGFGINEEE